jgi:hypothetical protein
VNPEDQGLYPDELYEQHSADGTMAPHIAAGPDQQCDSPATRKRFREPSTEVDIEERPKRRRTSMTQEGADLPAPEAWRDALAGTSAGHDGDFIFKQ